MLKSFAYQILLLGFISSCQSVRMTHNQVMNSLNTKERVIELLGPPHKTYAGENSTIFFVYDYSGTLSLSTPTEVETHIRGNTARSTITPGVNYNVPYSKWAIFHFDQNGYVINWNTHNINAQIKEFSWGRSIVFTILLGGLIATGFIL